MLSRAVEAFSRFVNARDTTRALTRARTAFVAIWLVYDVIDVVFRETERERFWFPHRMDPDLAKIQLALIAVQALLLFGRLVYPLGLAAAALRYVEADRHWALNDFWFYAVLMFLFAHSGERLDERGERYQPRWVRDLILYQLGFVYVATAVMKMNPHWLSGGHIMVRTRYLAEAFHWPFPGVAMQCFESLRCTSLLAWGAVGLELALGVTLFLRRPYWLAVALVCMVHGFGMFGTNVWFFSLSMLVCVAFLMPRSRSRAQAVSDKK